MPSESSISNPSLSNGLAFGVSIALFLYILSKYWFSSHRLPYPPGPRPLPIVGNLFDMPRTKYTLAWTKLGEEYGPLTWLTVPGQSFLIVNSMEAAKELLEKRGSVYVDRPKFVFLGEMIGADYFTSLTRYGPLWRKHRSLLKHALSPEVIKRDYSALLTKNAEQYVNCLVERPGAFEEDLKRVMAESTVILTYGRLRDEQDRDYVQLNSYVLETTLKASQGYIVDLIPALRCIPSWVPGMKFKRDAARWRDEFHEITRTMFERAKKSVISGEADEMSSFMTNNLRDLYRKQEQMLNGLELEADEAAISHSGFTFFLAAVETTQYSVHSFLLAMVLFPSVQEKARLEIDRVVGDGRLPTFDDQQDMPYLHAILLETLRWNTVVTTGLPHASLRDDIYDGYFIPKGTTVVPNSWGISRNTRYYSNPSVFDPERYLGPVPELDPRQFAFGFGRRICPGNELAFQAIWIMAAYILWSFRLERGKDDTSLPGDDLERFNLGFFSDPVSFKCEFLPRRENLRDKLKRSAT